jgi:hypothetical protein
VRGWSGYPDLIDWSESVRLLRRDSFVYGPFSWVDRSSLKIARDVWVDAIQAIIDKRTRVGTLFWKGFEDSVFIEAGVTNETLKQAKEITTKEEGGACIPVLFSELRKSRQEEIRRLTHEPKYERPDCYKYCYPSESDSNVKDDKKRYTRQQNKVGGWMVFPRKRK